MNRYIIVLILVLSMVCVSISTTWAGEIIRDAPTGIAGYEKNTSPWKSKVFILYINKGRGQKTDYKGRWAENVKVIKYTDSLLIVKNVKTNKIAMILLNSDIQIVLQEVGYY